MTVIQGASSWEIDQAASVVISICSRRMVPVKEIFWVESVRTGSLLLSLEQPAKA
ncbi:MAG: hypothetical protein ACLR8Y_03830 [Alistipes indistinctus]